MKKLCFLLIIAMSLMSLMSCGSKNSPRGIADAFLSSLKKNNIAAAKEYSTTRTHKIIDMMVGFGTNDVANAQGYKIINDTLVQPEHAWVYYSLIPDQGTNRMELVKIEDKWKVDMGGK